MRSLRIAILFLCSLIWTHSTKGQTGCFSGWSYVQSVDVVNQTGNVLSDYQVALDFDSQNLISLGHMQASGADIRFSTSDCCTQLPVWIQSGINTANTKVWTRVPVIPAFGTVRLYMYYGNAFAPSVEHIDSVMFSTGNNSTGTIGHTANTTINTKEMSFAANSLTVRWRLYSGNTASFIFKTSNTSDQVIASSPQFSVPAAPGFYSFDWEAPAVQGGNPGIFGPSSLEIMNSCGTPCPGSCGNQATGAGDVPVFGMLSGSDCGSFPSMKVWYRRAIGPDPAVSLLNDEFQLSQALEIIGGGPVFACNGTPVNLAVPGVGATSYQWYHNGVPVPGATDTLYIATYSGNFQCVANFGACKNVHSDVVTVNIIGVPVNLGNDSTFCTNSAFTLDAGLGSNYLWSTGSTNSSISINNTGTYFVSMDDTLGCPQTDTIQITIFPLPVAEIVPSGPVNFCEGGSVDLDASDPVWLAYQWNVANTTSSSFTVSDPGSFFVVAFDANGCSDTSDIITVTVYPQPNVYLGPDTVLCETDSILLDAGPFPATLWSWGLTAQTYWVTFSGTYVVEIIDSNSCRDIDSIEVNYFLSPVVDLGSDLVLCPNDVYTLDAGSGFAAYAWNNNTSNQYLDAGPGYHRVTVTDLNGCQGISNLLFIEAFPQTPVPVITGDADGLAASAAVNYQWFFNGNPISGATNQTLIPDSSGSYHVEVTDTNACGVFSSNTIQIEIIDELTAADIPEGFSPNGDAINDNFQIRNLDLFGENSLKVFGRWGQLVYERAPYTGDFNGKSDNGTDLPDGTYIYILDLGNGQDPFSGTLIINR